MSMKNIIMVFMVSLASCSSDSELIVAPDQYLAENACAIHCTKDSAFPGVAVSVTCDEYALPICQCESEELKAASCRKSR